jgi:hypothetical protein
MNLKVINTRVITVEDMENIQYLDGFSLPNRVYRAYIGLTKGNENTKYNDARKKLIRNIMLSYEAPVKERLEHKRVFYYGNLLIQLNMEENSICYVQNNLGIHCNFRLDKEKRKALNYIMGISE